MLLLTQFSPLIAGYFGSWELVLILSAVLLFFGSGKLPPAMRRALTILGDESDQISFDAGRSVGGIYGKPAAEALTHDNHTAELYKPAAIQNNGPHSRFKKTLLGRLFKWLSIRSRQMRKTIQQLFKSIGC